MHARASTSPSRFCRHATHAARSEARWNLEQLAAALRRDARQVRRWIANEETVQLQVVMTVPELRRPFVIALARQTKCFAIRTVIEELIA